MQKGAVTLLILLNISAVAPICSLEIKLVEISNCGNTAVLWIMLCISSDKGGVAKLCHLIKFFIALVSKRDFRQWLCNDGYPIFNNGLQQTDDLPFGKSELWPAQDFIVFIKDAVIVAGSKSSADYRI